MKKAFTLIELAIVLVIIGFLVGGVLAGTELINQAKLRSVIKEFEGYKTAFKTFKLKYQQMPGDMTDSRSNVVFGETISSRGTTDYFDGSTNTENDGLIQGDTEGVYALRQLSLSNLLSGEYTGTAGTGVPGTNIGSSDYSSDTGWNFFTLGMNNNRWAYGSGNTVWELTESTVVVFGKADIGNFELAGNRALTAYDAYQIDLKLDNGSPNTGHVMGDHGYLLAYSSSDRFCHSFTASYADDWNSTLSAPEYQVSIAEDLACRMMFVVDRR